MDFFANDVNQKMIESGQKKNVDEVLAHIPINAVLNNAFRNNGNFQFSNEGKAWGFTQPSFSNGAAYGDLDNDGDLDLIINNENQPAFVYKNNAREQNKNNYIGIMLRGRDKNTYAIGSKIKLYHDGQINYREVVPSRGFQSSVDYKQIIGLGSVTKIDSMIITWPDRSYTKYDHPEINKTHVLQQPQQTQPMPTEQTVTPTLLQSVPVVMDKHKEDDYTDFYDERNLPEMLSAEGPKIAKGDVNGDGLEDIYIGGAKDQPGQLYLQTGNGFIKKEETVFRQYGDFEDVAVLFFDADGDGDLDLFIGAGGNNVRSGGRELQHRLYKNDGKGNFTIDTEAFPSNDMNISVAVANDYDGDGDEDLFVGGRSVPYAYGVSPRSYIYRNDGNGHFSDVTAALNNDIATIGMVTGAVWSDVNGDNKKELVITGEWMATRIFSYNKSNNKFEELQNTGLNNLFGWWQTVSSTDVNGDGKEDLVLGNIGENFYLRPDADHPVKLWLNDFDRNGTAEQFLTRTIEGKDMPVFLKREITDQFPALKKQNLKHSEYARKTIQDLFGKEVIDQSQVKQFNYCKSVIAINEGNGKFSIEPLPLMVQLSSVNAIKPVDINNDNKPDLIMGGNLFGFPPQFGRLDASYGHVLINEGNGKFSWIEPKRSGMSLRGAIKDIQEIKTKNKNYILVAQNDETPALFEIKK